MSKHLPVMFGLILSIVFLVLVIAIAPNIFGELEASGDANLTNSSQFSAISGITFGAISFLHAGAFLVGAMVLILAIYVLRRV